jgi:hypothetical protein
MELQSLYSKAAYESPVLLPAHLLDQFLIFAISLARQKTALAQGLSEAGVMQLINAVQHGWYPYLEAEDLEPREVRRMLRQRMCEDALKVLSERLYLAAQAQMLYQTPSQRPPVEETSRARLRPRPSWMATGG